MCYIQKNVFRHSRCDLKKSFAGSARMFITDFGVHVLQYLLAVKLFGYFHSYTGSSGSWHSIFNDVASVPSSFQLHMLVLHEKGAIKLLVGSPLP